MLADFLLVDDDPGTIQLLGRILSGIGSVRFATNGEDALRLAGCAAPDLILLDAEMPGLSGFQVCAALKANPTLAGVPVIFVTSHRDQAFEIAGFAAGAADFIVKPVSPPLVLARVSAQLRMKRMADELRHSAMVDALTGVANRRRFDDALSTEWLRAQRAREPISLVMVDVDHFKLFNDRYGHPAGDACLRSIAQALVSACLRPADLVSRYGGEEFALLLPQTPAAGAQHVAQRILDIVQAVDIPHASSPVSTHVTVSVGIAHYGDAPVDWQNLSARPPPSADVFGRPTPQGLIEVADRALYAAKRAGRAQACLVPLIEIADSASGGELRSSQRMLVSRRIG
jgi:diguanylate cyclase (GGDEF)-like protein